MNKTFIKAKRALFLSFFMMLIVSCETAIQAPYVISHLECSIVDEDDLFTFAGVLFAFTNTSSKTIISMEIHFNVFDSKTKKSPFIANNHIVSILNQNIEPTEAASICISLDEYMHYAPEQAYSIDQFYITKIAYEDGSSWSDDFGVFALSKM